AFGTIVANALNIMPALNSQSGRKSPALQIYLAGSVAAGTGAGGAGAAATGAAAGGCAPAGTTCRGACVPEALPAKGISAMLRARLMATPSQRWGREQTPVIRRGRILPRSCTNCERMSARL